MIGISTRLRVWPACVCGAVSIATMLVLAVGGSVARAACSNETLREGQHALFLPDCRAFEMVSPSDKQGAEVMTGAAKIRAAADGSASTFRSLLPFGDAMGTGITVEYVADRSTSASPGDNGWSTHAVTPAQEPMNVELVLIPYEPTYLVTSPDLDSGVLTARSLTGDPLVAKVPNLYTRSDLRAGGAGVYALMSPCTLCEATSIPLPTQGKKLPAKFADVPRLAGASLDMSRVLFESTLALTAGSNAKAEYPDGVRDVYESDHGVSRLVSVIPSSGRVECVDPECVVPAGGANAGIGEFSSERSQERHAFSTDGTRAVFTANPTGNTCTAVGSGECGELYLRELGEPSRTVKINASERVSPGASRPAAFQDASSDLSRVFFTSSEQLTETPGNGLYMFDLDAPVGHRLTLIGPTGESVLGASEDGHYVYFTASTQLVSGQPGLTDSESNGVYLWHDGPGAPPDGELRYIGELRYGRVALQTEQARFEEARVTPDGHYLLFPSVSGVGLLSNYGGIDYDQQDGCAGRTDCSELYVYDAVAGGLVCASCRADHVGASVGATIRASNQTTEGAAITTGIHETRAISTNGRYVFFTTAEPLVAQDTNGVADAYEYDTLTGEVHLLSGAESPDPSYFTDASADGTNAFFLTRSKLVGWDVDRAYDLYDARTNGGFPEPPPLPPSCQGDACQPPPVALIDQTPGTLTFTGPGSPISTPQKDSMAHKKNVRHKKRNAHRRKRRRAHSSRHKRSLNVNSGGQHGKSNKGGHR